MKEFERLDTKLDLLKYLPSRYNEKQQLWKKIKEDKELLSWAVKSRRDKFDERDSVNGASICESILLDYKSIDKDTYKELVGLIYSNEQIARIVNNGYSNGGYSYLLMTLFNFDLRLTSEQKEFAVREAMNKIGTTKYKDTIAKHEYINQLFESTNTTQAHGIGEFDIRYWILKNPNWSLEEKEKLIFEFWADDEEYDKTLEEWEWNIVNDLSNYKDSFLPLFDRRRMYDYTYETLLKFYGNKETTDRIWQEIEFCRQMHKLRKTKCELKQEKSITLQNKR